VKSKGAYPPLPAVGKNRIEKNFEPSFIDDNTKPGSALSEDPSDAPLELKKPEPFTMPADPYLDCYAGEGMDKATQPFVDQPFAQAAIGKFCASATATLSADDNIYEAQFAINDDTTLWIGAGWQIGDASCQTARAITPTECAEQLGMVLNNCDTDSRKQKYGGSRVNSCVAWMMGIDGKMIRVGALAEE
jgi:hypothetical protein